MPIGSIYSAKDNAAAKQPLLLGTITFADGAVLRVSSHAVTYGGDDYLPYIENQEITALQAMGEQGIDVPASVNLRLADSDYTLWSNYEIEHGFRGSRLQLVAVLYDALAGGFSSDSRVIFNGVCKEPGGKLPAHDGKTLTIGYASRLNMADLSLPSIKIQKICPWIFPETESERQAGADDAESRFYPCGYSPDATGGDARGNLDGGSPFTSCDYTADACRARGMFEKDSADRVTGRFGGIQWNPSTDSFTVKNYISGKEIDVKSDPNEAKYGDCVPMLWGRSWTDPLVLHVIPDGNFVTINALVCYGEVDAIFDVVVNDTHIPHTYDDTESPISTGIGVPNATEAAKGGWWKCLNRGDRDGAPGVAGQDPYGSMCVLQLVVPHAISGPGSTPRVRVYCERGTAYPSEQIEDILKNWAGWESAELYGASFTAAQGVDSAVITSGSGGSVYRFTSSLYLRQRESLADVLRGLRNCRRGILTADSSGLLRLGTEQTLAAQQPSLVTGSNYSTPIASKTAAGVVANGYAAYKFDESNILGMPTVSLANAGNRFSLAFQNAQNLHSMDALQVVDSEDVRRVDQEIPGNFTLRGVDNYDQLKRLIATYTAKQLRGNWRGDTGGTLLLDFEASSRALHLSIGDIVLVNWELLGISDQLFRVARISPATNFETAKLTVSWHDDDWYTDSWGQAASPDAGRRYRDRLSRPSFPWQPYGEPPVVGDSLVSQDTWNFGVSQSYGSGADGEVLAKVSVYGRQIVNVVSQTVPPPIVPLQGETASTGGSLEGGRAYYVAIAAADADGKLSSLSRPVTVYVPAGTDTNTITVSDLSWDAGAAGHYVFAGTNPSALSFQRDGSDTPASITLGTISAANFGPPDTEFDRYRIRIKREIHGGLWGTSVLAVTSTTIQLTVPGGGFDVDQWAGYDITWYSRANDAARLPVANFRIASNTSDTLTLAPGSPDPVDVGIEAGDVMVLRAKPTVGSDEFGTYLEDPGWKNVFYPAGMVPDGEIGYLVRVMHGTGAGQSSAPVKGNTATRHYVDLVVTPDSTSRYIIEEPTWRVVHDTDRVNNSSAETDAVLSVDVTNDLGQSLLIQVLTLDGGLNESIESLSPVRELYLFGKSIPATANQDGYYDASIVADQVTIDLSNGLNQRVTLNQATRVTILNPVFTGGTISAGSWFQLYILQDATGSRPSPAFGTEFAGDVDLPEHQIGPDASTRTAIGFTYDGSKWGIDTFKTGLPV
jgi:hypothetical protein